MRTMVFINLISASAVLALLSCIHLATSQNTLNEHLVLGDGGSTSHEAVCITTTTSGLVTATRQIP